MAEITAADIMTRDVLRPARACQFTRSRACWRPSASAASPWSRRGKAGRHGDRRRPHRRPCRRPACRLVARHAGRRRRSRARISRIPAHAARDGAQRHDDGHHLDRRGREDGRHRGADGGQGREIGCPWSRRDSWSASSPVPIWCAPSPCGLPIRRHAASSTRRCSAAKLDRPALGSEKMEKQDLPDRKPAGRRGERPLF